MKKPEWWVQSKVLTTYKMFFLQFLIEVVLCGGSIGKSKSIDGNGGRNLHLLPFGIRDVK